MKKFITLSLLVASFAFTATFASAQTNFQQNGRYDQNQRDNRRNDQRNDRNTRNNRVRIETQTRIVRQGKKVFRETVQIKYLPNGRTQTKVISRVRVR